MDLSNYTTFAKITDKNRINGWDVTIAIREHGTAHFEDNDRFSFL